MLLNFEGTGDGISGQHRPPTGLGGAPRSRSVGVDQKWGGHALRAPPRRRGRVGCRSRPGRPGSEPAWATCPAAAGTRAEPPQPRTDRHRQRLRKSHVAVLVGKAPFLVGQVRVLDGTDQSPVLAHGTILEPRPTKPHCLDRNPRNPDCREEVAPTAPNHRVATGPRIASAPCHDRAPHERNHDHCENHARRAWRRATRRHASVLPLEPGLRDIGHGGGQPPFSAVIGPLRNTRAQPVPSIIVGTHETSVLGVASVRAIRSADRCSHRRGPQIEARRRVGRPDQPSGLTDGLMLAFRWKRLSGSYSPLMRDSRSYFAGP